MKSSGLSRFTPFLLSVLRLAAAFTYIAHGTQKLFGVPGQPFHAPVFAATMMTAAGVIETLGGICMFLGLFTRPGGVRAVGPDGGRLLHAARAGRHVADP